MSHEKSNHMIQDKDILGNVKPSFLFFPMVKMLSYVLRCDPKRNLSSLSISVKKIIHPVIMLLVPLFMDYRQVIESKNNLIGIDEPDEPLHLPKDSVIWCVNHGFKDDIAASIRATRHSYVFFGSLPHFFNTFDGIALFLNGVILCNRKNRAMKRASFELAVQSLKKGNDLTVFPEGVWNKTPEKLMLDFWPGIYRMAKETGNKVVPVVHYLSNPHKKYKGNVIHTVIADPISLEGLSEMEGLTLLRDTMATWYYLLMEKYGQTTRKDLLNDFDTADEAWERYVAMHTGHQRYYDTEIELCADYRPKDIVRGEDVWKSVANIKHIQPENIGHIQYARELTIRDKVRDFQRRY